MNTFSKYRAGIFFQVACLLMLGSSAWAQDPGQPQFKATLSAGSDDRTAPPVKAAASNFATSTFTFNGGIVQHNQKVFTIFWFPPGTTIPSGYQNSINQFVQDLNGSSYYNIASQYSDNNGAISNTLIYGGTWLDTTNALPNNAPSYSDLLNEVNRAKTANGWTSDVNSYFQVYTPVNVGTSAGSGFCGLHWLTTPSIGQIMFPRSGCFISSPWPTDQTIDAAISVSAHEIIEALTDPVGDGWFDSNGDEIADLCNFNFGTRASDGSNVTLSGRKYIIQRQWSNATSACVSSYLPPLITTQPGSSSISSGQTTTLSVVASGASPITYQWYQGSAGVTTTPVGTNSSSYTTPALNTSTTYWVKLSNSDDTKNSQTATVTVSNSAPSITTHPAGSSILSGQTATLSVVAIGPGTLSYQWYRGNSGSTASPVGTNSTSFTTPSLTTTTSYWVRVSNAFGSADSTTATVTTSTTAAQIVSPTNGSTLSGTTITFTRDNASPAASAYYLWVGTSSRSINLVNVQMSGTSIDIQVPATGQAVYATIWSLISGTLYPQDYTFTADAPSAQITSPLNGATVASSVTFTRTSVANASAYYLWVGSAPRTLNYVNVQVGGTTIDIALPAGQTVYATLWSLINGVLYARDYTYTTSAAVVAAQIGSPVGGATLTTTTVTFSRGNSVPAASTYYLWVGTSSRSIDLVNSAMTSTSLDVSIPLNGQPVYVTLWSLVNGTLYPQDYIYTAAANVTAAQITSATALSQSPSTVVFTRGSSSPVASAYYLWVGTSSRSINLANALMSGTTINVTVPTGSQPVYATLWSLVNGVLYPKDYTYTSFGPSSGAGVTVTHDFSGDGKSDVLWRDDEQVSMWRMNGSALANDSPVANVPATSTIAGVGDFNGDGRADILWRDKDYNVSMWLMNGAAIENQSFVKNWPAWSIVGIADFDGDGKADILWRDKDGNLALWLMDGSTVDRIQFIAGMPGSTPIHIGDFDGDGKADILWRDKDGNISMWLMDSSSIVRNSFVANASTGTFVGAGDFDGDGKADLLWHDASGDLVMWLMDGPAVSSKASVDSISTTWQLVQIGDYDGDGKADILWRDTAKLDKDDNAEHDDRAILMWHMNGATILSTTTLKAMPADSTAP